MVKNIIAIAAGKGGVGKSTLTAQLAYHFDALGYKVGVLDADLYGPSIPKMMPPTSFIGVTDCESFLKPAYKDNISLISISFWPQAQQGLFARAPIANQLILQMLEKVQWEDLDFLLIDFPPGTGDIQLTLLQQGKVNGAIILTTPQEVAALDVEKTIRMFNSASVPIWGVIENMSYLQKEGLEKIKIFNGDMGKRLSEEFNLDFLGELPLDPDLAQAADAGSFFPIPQLFEIVEYIAAKACEYKETIAIKKASLLNEYRLQIIWNDGLVSEYNFSDLQASCPCIQCLSHPKQFLHDVKALSFHQVGRYALQFSFEKGCSRGIYSFERLYRLYMKGS